MWECIEKLHKQNESCAENNERCEQKVEKGEHNEGTRKKNMQNYMSDAHEKGELSERKVSFLARDKQIAKILESISCLQFEIANESDNYYPEGDDG